MNEVVYIRWMTGQRSKTFVAIAAFVTGAIAGSVIQYTTPLAVDRLYRTMFPLTPATDVVPFAPFGQRIGGGTGLTAVKPSEVCYRASLRFDSRYAFACRDDQYGGYHDPCFIAPPTKNLLLCYEEPWVWTRLLRASKFAEPPPEWRAALARPRNQLPLALSLWNGQRCVVTLYPELEQPSNPDRSTYMCSSKVRKVIPLNAERAEGFIYGPIRRGRTWKVRFVPAGRRFGVDVEVRRAWEG